MALNPSSFSQTVSAIAVVDLAHELLGLGCIDQSFFDQLGAEFNAANESWLSNQLIQEARLPERLLTDLWQQADQARGNPDIGLQIGSKVNDQARGVLANWLFQCATWSEAFDTFSRNIHLLNPSERWVRANEADTVKLSLQFRSACYPSIAIDRSMAACVSWSAVLIAAPIQPAAVSFTRAQPKALAPYEAIFGQNLLFGAAENAIVFPSSIATQPIQAANPYLKSLIEKQAMALSASLVSPQSINDKVTALLHKDLATYCQITEVCEALHVSRTTLYRKLKGEGVSYTHLVKEARIQTMRRMKQQTANASDLAEALGFQDIGSYYRFRKQVDRQTC